MICGKRPSCRDEATIAVAQSQVPSGVLRVRDERCDIVVPLLQRGGMRVYPVSGIVVVVLDVRLELARHGQMHHTAVIVTWDDSDGWYDHAYADPTSPSFDPTADRLNGSGVCATGAPADGLSGKPVNGRCGPGTRIPFLVISPYAKVDYVSHGFISQASVARFIEDNWLDGQRLGGGPFDATTVSLMDMFDFSKRHRNPRLFLSSDTGTPIDRDDFVATR